MLIVGGMVQGGVLLWASNTLNQVVRDTGRYAATICGPSAATTSEGVFSTLYAASGGPWQNPVVDVDYNSDPGSPACPDDNQDVTWVTVTASVDAFVFFPVLPGNGHVSSSTTFRVEPLP
jgi:hypothetical protein